MSKLFLVRHGQSEWNSQNRFTGWVDVNLSDQGRAEAKKSGEITAKPMDRIITQPVLPREIDLKDPFWYVVSDKNIDEFHERLTKEHGQIVFVAMSIPDYELMSYNMQELKRYITELKEVVVYYEKVTDPEALK